MTHLIALRHALAQHFEPADVRTRLLRLREASLLPAGAPGRDGSAEITPQHAALALLAMVADAEPVDSPAAAQEIARYRAVA
ncbi:MAG: hypothetical protein ACREFB_10350 [Stellaceae bacterium]